MSSSLQNILIIGGIVVLAGLGYYLFTQNSSSSLQNSQVNNVAAAETAQFLQRLQAIEQIEIETSFFSDQSFTSLRSFSRDIQPEPYGKPNPFGAGN